MSQILLMNLAVNEFNLVSSIRSEGFAIVVSIFIFLELIDLSPLLARYFDSDFKVKEGRAIATNEYVFGLAEVSNSPRN